MLYNYHHQNTLAQNIYLLYQHLQLKLNDGHVGVSGLTPGLHTIRVTFNNAGSIVYFNPGIEIITPIHSPHTTFGSLSMKDIRNFDSQKDINKKAKQKETQVKFLESSGVG